jgi:uncharacterized protein (DUF2384 family)
MGSTAKGNVIHTRTLSRVKGWLVKTSKMASLRKRTALELANALLQNPGEWLKTPNSQLGDRLPIDLIGTEEELRVYNLLNAVDQGLF